MGGGVTMGVGVGVGVDGVGVGAGELVELDGVDGVDGVGVGGGGVEGTVDLGAGAVEVGGAALVDGAAEVLGAVVAEALPGGKTCCWVASGSFGWPER